MIQLRHGRRLLGCILLLTFVGCTSVNIPLNAPNIPLESRANNHTRAGVGAPVPVPAITGAAPSAQSPVAEVPSDRDGWFVGLALSGGGSRSANFSAACMLQLERIGLLQRVDYISSVSGGSLTAAYYCLSGPKEWNPGRVQQKLSYPFASDLIGRALLPWNLFAFTFTDWDRSDVLAGIFQDRLFTQNGRAQRFVDLRNDRPKLLINATDLQSGHRFVFSNETFNELNSDLGRYPIAYAVAASSAVPVVLHPVTLRDHSTVFPEFRHLIDGGVSDNLGVQTLAETYSAQTAEAEKNHRPDPYPHGAVFVVIDAHTQFNAQLSDRGDVGLFSSLKAATGLTSTALLNRASSATLAEIIVNNSPDRTTAAEIRSEIAALTAKGYLRLIDRHQHPVYVIYITLAQVNGMTDLPFVGFSESVNDIGTYFSIEPTEAYRLYQAADLLVRQKFEEPIRAVMREMVGTAKGT